MLYGIPLQWIGPSINPQSSAIRTRHICQELQCTSVRMRRCTLQDGDSRSPRVLPCQGLSILVSLIEKADSHRGNCQINLNKGESTFLSPCKTSSLANMVILCKSTSNKPFGGKRLTLTWWVILTT